MKKIDEDTLKIFLSLSICLSLVLAIFMQNFIFNVGTEAMQTGMMLISSLPLTIPYANILSFLLMALYWWFN